MGHKMNRPYVIINCAMSADGKISNPNKKQIRISNDEDIKRMYKLRNSCDAILVGIGAVLSDNPKLTVKEKYVSNPKNPIRIILDSQCRTPVDYFAVDNKSRSIIVTTKKCSKTFGYNVEIIQCKKDINKMVNLIDLLDLLYKRGIKKLMVEGGGTVIWSFIKKSLVDDIFIYMAPIVIGGKSSPTIVNGSGFQKEKDMVLLELVNLNKLGDGILLHYKLKQ
jgi:2,5-diamino-6-(ribosylamino)-4(3H)-pyrimidinone 5'-phosphate reductase